MSIILLELDDDFKIKISEFYMNDFFLISIFKIIKDYYKKNKSKIINKIINHFNSLYHLLFSIKTFLLFYKNLIDNHLYFYLSKKIHKEIFIIVYNRENHFDIAKIYTHLIINYFI